MSSFPDIHKGAYASFADRSRAMLGPGHRGQPSLLNTKAEFSGVH